MTALSEDEAKALADQYLNCDQFRKPHEETTKADELYQFWTLVSQRWTAVRL